ncbi:MAG TPA: DUF6624 domain-containing protein, partial [Dehalococcoidia bacterium]
GFPGKSLAGEEGAQAAWIILQHAISMPALQRKSLALITELANQGEIPRTNAAMLEDRIRYLEGKRQVYGTQFDWDENGELSPLPIEDVNVVDALREKVGLPPLEVSIQQYRALAKRHGERPPTDGSKKQAEFEAWAKRVGWRT